MKRRVVIYATTSRAIKTFGLEREELIQLLGELHHGLPARYQAFRHRRAVDVRKFFFRISVQRKGGGQHVFVVVVDDTTSPEHPFVTNIGHSIIE